MDGHTDTSRRLDNGRRRCVVRLPCDCLKPGMLARPSRHERAAASPPRHDQQHRARSARAPAARPRRLRAHEHAPARHGADARLACRRARAVARVRRPGRLLSGHLRLPLRLRSRGPGQVHHRAGVRPRRRAGHPHLHLHRARRAPGVASTTSRRAPVRRSSRRSRSASGRPTSSAPSARPRSCAPRSSAPCPPTARTTRRSCTTSPRSRRRPSRGSPTGTRCSATARSSAAATELNLLTDWVARPSSEAVPRAPAGPGGHRRHGQERAGVDLVQRDRAERDEAAGRAHVVELLRERRPAGELHRAGAGLPDRQAARRDREDPASAIARISCWRSSTASRTWWSSTGWSASWSPTRGWMRRTSRTTTSTPRRRTRSPAAPACPTRRRSRSSARRSCARLPTRAPGTFSAG